MDEKGAKFARQEGGRASGVGNTNHRQNLQQGREWGRPVLG